MSTLQCVFLVLVFVLFSSLSYDDSLYLKRPFLKTTSTKLIHIEKILSHPNKDVSEITKSLILGKRPRGEINEAVKNLQLQHLLTPSGLHLSSALILLAPLKRTVIYKIFLFVLNILFIFISGFYSLKRVLLMRLLTTFGVSTKKSFACVFIYDFLIGSFLDSPWSFTYSFLFLGLIVLFSENKIKLFISLYIAQLLLGLWQQESFSLATPLINFLVSSGFSLFFLLYLLTTILYSVFGLGFGIEFMSLIFRFIIILANELNSFLPLVSSMQLSVLSYCFLYISNRRILSFISVITFSLKAL